MYWENGDDLSEIARRCQRVAVIIKRATESDNLMTDSHLFNAIEELQGFVTSKHSVSLTVAHEGRFVEGMCKEVESKLDRGTLRKALSVYSDSKRIKGLKELLRDFLQDFQVC